MTSVKRLHPLVTHLLYGDIEEMPLAVLDVECPDTEKYDLLDTEQKTRLAAAATVQAWLNGRLHVNGYLWNAAVHSPADRVPWWPDFDTQEEEMP